jgi:RNA polymerase sigma-70 factor (ECF subfamily)
MDHDGQPFQVAELTRAMTRGDEAAYRMFYQHYQPRLFRYLWVVARGRDAEAQDALQATLLRVVKYIRIFEREEVFWSWLTRVARSALSDDQKKQRRYWSALAWLRVPIADASRGDQEAAAHTGAAGADSQLFDWLDDCITALPDADRQLLEARYFSRVPVRAIAGENETSEKAIQSKLARIRLKLRASLSERLRAP